MKPENVPPKENCTRYTILAKAGYTTGLFYNPSGKFAYRLYTDKPKEGEAEHPSAPGVYHHVVATISIPIGTCTLYVDGVFAGTNNWQRNRARDYAITPWRIGVALPNDKTFRAAIKGVNDEVRIYNRILSAGEAAILAGLPYRKK